MTLLALDTIGHLDFDTPRRCELPDVAAWRATHGAHEERIAVGLVRRLPCGHATPLCEPCSVSWFAETGALGDIEPIIRETPTEIQIITVTPSCAICDGDLTDARWEPLP